METKICSKCKERKPVSEFYKSARDGRRSVCISCQRIAAKEYNSRPESRERHKIWWRLYKKEYYARLEPRKRLRAFMRAYIKGYSKRPLVKLKAWARRYTSNAVVAGEITREPCTICGEEQTEAHHLDYERPYIIMWLCRGCHKKVHKE